MSFLWRFSELDEQEWCEDGGEGTVLVCDKANSIKKKKSKKNVKDEN
jgi:hypothetical protein